MLPSLRTLRSESKFRHGIPRFPSSPHGSLRINQGGCYRTSSPSLVPTRQQRWLLAQPLGTSLHGDSILPSNEFERPTKALHWREIGIENRSFRFKARAKCQTEMKS